MKKQIIEIWKLYAGLFPVVLHALCFYKTNRKTMELGQENGT
jgi:hypothetical protein